MSELDAHDVALEVAGAVLERARCLSVRVGAEAKALVPLTDSPLYLEVHELAVYAQGYAPLSTRRELFDRVHELAKATGAKLTREPTEPIEVVLQGAVARYHLERGQELSVVELAILIGYNRDSVLSIAASVPSSRRLPDGSKPWRFKPTKALKAWMRDAEVRRARVKP